MPSPITAEERAAALAASPIWTLTQNWYQYLCGVHQPHIAEISPMQYAGLSGRERKRYDARRSQEWTASGACKVEYDQLVYEAYKRGEFKLTDEGVTKDAKSAVAYLSNKEREEAREQAIQAARIENQILRVSDAEEGDRVWIVGYSTYAIITKKLKVSFRVSIEGGREYKIAAGACNWLKYDDMVKAVDEGRSVNPHKIKEAPEPPPSTPAPAAAAIQQREPETESLATVTQFRAPQTAQNAPKGVTRGRAEEIIREEMDKHGLRVAGWTYGFMSAQRVFGTCNETNKALKFSLPILALNTEDDLRDCVRHEVAHAKAGHKAGHGRTWKLMALACGANPQRTCGAHIVTPENKFHATCQECGHVHKMTRVPKNTKYCGHCIRKNLNPYMTRSRKQEVFAQFKLIWVEQVTGRSFERQGEEIVTAEARTQQVEVERPKTREPEVWTVAPIAHASQPNLF